MRKLLGLAIATLSLAALLPAQGRWNLDVECGKLKPVSLQTGPTTWETWWYVVVTVKNGTGAERHMNFTARAETDTRKTAPAVFRPRVLQEIEAKEWLAPIDPRAIICIGANYKAHAEESGKDVPEYPIVFMKNPNAAIGHEQPIKIPKVCDDEVDYEAELVEIGRASCRERV